MQAQKLQNCLCNKVVFVQVYEDNELLLYEQAVANVRLRQKRILAAIKPLTEADTLLNCSR